MPKQKRTAQQQASVKKKEAHTGPTEWTERFALATISGMNHVWPIEVLESHGRLVYCMSDDLRYVNKVLFPNRIIERHCR